MIPRVFNWVDMGDIDLAYIHGQTIFGLYSKITSAVTSDGVAIFYNWKCANIPFPPSYVNISLYSDYLLINGLIKVTTGDVISIPGYDPTLVDLTVTESGVYTPSVGVDGFNLVTVETPEVVLTSGSFTENGDYVPESGIDGWDQININVAGLVKLTPTYTNKSGSYTTSVSGDYYVTYDEETAGVFDFYELPDDLSGYMGILYVYQYIDSYGYFGFGSCHDNPLGGALAPRLVALNDYVLRADKGVHFKTLLSATDQTSKYVVSRHTTTSELYLVPTVF